MYFVAKMKLETTLQSTIGSWKENKHILKLHSKSQTNDKHIATLTHVGSIFRLRIQAKVEATASQVQQNIRATVWFSADTQVNLQNPTKVSVFHSPDSTLHCLLSWQVNSMDTARKREILCTSKRT